MLIQRPATSRRIGIVVYPGFDILDLANVLSVFREAESLHPGAYIRQVASTDGGHVASSSGISVDSERLTSQPLDTLIVLGGRPEVVLSPPDALRQSIITLGATARRIASTCTGAFLLANAGLLDGKRCTTHWGHVAKLQAQFPELQVQSDWIFVNDGRIWTSAGGTAGIDLALALVEEDLGRDTSRQIAKELVVYHKRHGAHSQQSVLVELQPPSDRMNRALSFARQHLHEPLPVRRLADAANLSERHFSRAFLAETGMTPARAIERLRAEAAHPLVEEGRQPFEAIAVAVGFSDTEQMRQAFIRTFGHSPRAIRRMSHPISEAP